MKYEEIRKAFEQLQITNHREVEEYFMPKGVRLG